MSNVTTKKQYAGTAREMPVSAAEPTKSVNYSNAPGSYKGELDGPVGGGHFSEPMNKGAPSKIAGLDGLHDDIGEKSGFITDGYLDKNGTPFGESAKFNFMPPGMDIGNQENCEIHEMPLRTYSGGVSYPDDGWSPAPRHIKE